MYKCIVCGTELTEDSHLLLCKNMPESAQRIPSKEEMEQAVYNLLGIE